MPPCLYDPTSISETVAESDDTVSKLKMARAEADEREAVDAQPGQFITLSSTAANLDADGYVSPPFDLKSRVPATVCGATGHWEYIRVQSTVMGGCPHGRSQHEQGCECGNVDELRWQFVPNSPDLARLASRSYQEVEHSIELL